MRNFRYSHCSTWTASFRNNNFHYTDDAKKCFGSLYCASQASLKYIHCPQTMCAPPVLSVKTDIFLIPVSFEILSSFCQLLMHIGYFSPSLPSRNISHQAPIWYSKPSAVLWLLCRMWMASFCMHLFPLLIADFACVICCCCCFLKNSMFFLPVWICLSNSCTPVVMWTETAVPGIIFCLYWVLGDF